MKTLKGENLTQGKLKLFLDYNPETGVFIWKLNRNQNVRAGDIAGRVDEFGYRIIYVLGKKYRAGRLAWFWVTGEMPKQQIDHIDRNRSNDKFSNLREVDPRENVINRGIPKNNTSGVIGVTWYKNLKKWCAQIEINNKNNNLGYFKEKSDAVLARYNAEKEHGIIEFNPETTAFLFLKDNGIL